MGCLSLLDANAVIQAVFGDKDIDTTLEKAGFITDEQRKNLRAAIVQKVVDRGCNIAPGDVPNDGATNLRAIRAAIFEKAMSVAGAGGVS
jgi:hypothetical protein